MSASPQLPPARFPGQGNPLRQMAPAQWRTLLQLLEHLDAMPTIIAREGWLSSLRRDDPVLGDALQRLLLQRNRLRATRFLYEPVITPEGLSSRAGLRAPLR